MVKVSVAVVVEEGDDGYPVRTVYKKSRATDDGAVIGNEIGLTLLDAIEAYWGSARCTLGTLAFAASMIDPTEDMTETECAFLRAANAVDKEWRLRRVK